MTAADHKRDLLAKIDARKARVAVYGLGYVGLPLALRFAQAGFPVTGFDIDRDKVAQLNAGESYMERIPARTIQDARAGGFQATTDYTASATADALILCLPTPLGPHHEPDLSHITATIAAITPHLRRGQVVSLESTTYPGTTEEELLPPITAAGLAVGREVFVVYSPEREDPGNPTFHTGNTPKVCGGVSPACQEVGVALYQAVVKQVVAVSSTRVAEMTKLLENIYRAVNIGLVNELSRVAEAMDIDLFEVIDAAATKPFGYTPFYPGPGLGGHCIPIDPFYLTWKAREFGVHTKFIELAGEVNTAMPAWYVRKAARLLNRAGKPLHGARVLVLGVAYKPNVDDLRESPALEIMHLLRTEGAEVAYADPHVPHLGKLRDYDFNLSATPLTAAQLAQNDLVILCTAHAGFDYPLIKRESRLLLDTRGAMRGVD